MVPRLMADSSSPPPAEPVSLEDIARVREVLARELETINSYEAHARATNSPALRDFFLHLAAEEKEHVAEAVLLLRELDAVQEQYFTRTVSADHFTAPSGRPAAAPAQAPPPEAVAKPTVSADLDLVEPPARLEPGKVVYGQQAPPTSHAGPFTVGSLRGTH